MKIWKNKKKFSGNLKNYGTPRDFFSALEVQTANIFVRDQF